MDIASPSSQTTYFHSKGTTANLRATEADGRPSKRYPRTGLAGHGSGYQIQIRLDPPLVAGTRPFGKNASSTTVAINVIMSGTTPASWTTGDGNGSGTLNADLKSGSLKGQLVGLGANGIATSLTGKFSCPTFTP